METTSFLLNNDIGLLSGFLTETEALLRKHGIHGEKSMHVQLSLDEILTNIISYGFQDFEVHRIEIKFTFDDTSVEIEVKDDGIPFNPLEIPEAEIDIPLEEKKIGGLGVYLVRTLIASVSYRFDEGKNILTLRDNK